MADTGTSTVSQRDMANAIRASPWMQVEAAKSGIPACDGHGRCGYGIVHAIPQVRRQQAGLA